MDQPVVITEISEFRNATLVDASTYDAQELCQGFQARRSVYEDVAIQASLQCRTDFEDAIGGIKLDDSVTYENPSHGHSVSNLMPLTLPERVELLGYTSEYLCLHDDEADAANASGDIIIDRKTVQKQLLMKLLTRFMVVNQKQGQAIMDAFLAYGMMAASLNKEQNFKTIEQYMDYRFHDFGSEFFLTTTLFGIDFDPLTAEERAIVEPFIQTGYRHISLLNDLFSFDVEWEDTVDKDQLVNGVCVYIRQFGATPSEAKDRVREVLVNLEADYKRHVYNATTQGVLNVRLQKFVSAIAQQMVGNLVWSSSCLRYNLAYRLANRANRKRTDSHVEPLVALSATERARSDSVLNQASKVLDAVTNTTTEIAVADGN